MVKRHYGQYIINNQNLQYKLSRFVEMAKKSGQVVILAVFFRLGWLFLPSRSIFRSGIVHYTPQNQAKSYGNYDPERQDHRHQR